MELHEISHRVKCDFYGCNNLAKYSFTTKGLLRRDLCFCEDCLEGMRTLLAKKCTPKGLESPFKLKQRLRREHE